MTAHPVADESHVDESPIDEHLLGLRSRGFTFAANRDEDGNIDSLVAVRVHHDLIDIVELYGGDKDYKDLVDQAREGWEGVENKIKD